MIRALVIFLFAAATSYAEPQDLILEIYTWDTKTAKTMSGWFADSDTIRAMEKTAGDAAPTRKLIAKAKEYLQTKVPKIIDSPFGDEGSIHTG